MNKSLAKNSLFNVIYTVSNILFPLIASMYISRILLADGVGRVSYAQNVVSYFTTFAALGLPVYGIREIAKARDNQNSLNEVFTELLLINAACTTISIILFALLLIITPEMRMELPLYLSCGLLLFLNYFNIDWLYQGIEEYVYISCRSILIKALMLLALVGVVHNKEQYVLYALVTSIATGGNYLFNIIYARRFVRLKFTNLKFKRHLKPLLVLAASVLFASLYSKVDTTMLGMLATKEKVGYYSYAQKTINIVVTVCTSISGAFLPGMSYLYQSDKVSFRNMVTLGTKILNFITIPMTTGFFMLAEPLVLVLYGLNFTPALPTIRVFCILILIKSYGNLLCYQLLICTNNEKLQLPSYGVAALINIILNAILIPSYQCLGAAVASIVSELVVNIWQFIVMKKTTSIVIDKKTLLQSVFSSGIMAISIMITLHLMKNIILQLLVSVIIGSCTYFIINYLMKNEPLFKVIDKISAKMCG